MGSDARSRAPSDSEFADVNPSATARVGDTTGADLATATGSYELHVLPKKARSSPTRETNDGHELDAESSALLYPSDQNMSRVPLLVRSSPALGTGSYGGLPVMSLSSSPGSDAENDHVAQLLQRSKRKGKSRLRDSEASASQSRTSIHRPRDDSTQSEPIDAIRSRRRSMKEVGRTRALRESFGDQMDSGLEPRFNASSVGPSGIIKPSVFENLQSSSSSSHIDIDDDEYDSEDDDFHDLKTNGHGPSDNSPYAEVRASVPATDDTSLSINTPRMWILSMFFAILGSSTNLFFSLRYPSVSITPLIALLLVHPLGLLWDQILKRRGDPEEVYVNGLVQSSEEASNGSADADSPNGSFHDAPIRPAEASRGRRTRLWLAQGRWNEKEHCCVYISTLR